MTSFKSRTAITLLAAAAAAACAGVDGNQGDGQAQHTGQAIAALVAGAGFTTMDAVQGGCLNGTNGIDCNVYEHKEDVYMSGGPAAAALSDGDYFFAVRTPGTQAQGFLDGANGNLSDTTQGNTDGDLGGGDPMSNRTFTVTSGVITYSGSHKVGTSPQGALIIQLMPYDNTNNNGGEYILGICRVGTTSARDCKYDAFKVKKAAEPPLPFGTVSGMKYYDANANGQLDSGEVGIADWLIEYHDGISATLTTDASGQFSASMTADTYTFQEAVSGIPQWFQTGNTVPQFTTSGGSSVTLNADMTYAASIVDGSTTTGIYFGNLCVGAGGGLTLGFWSNKNGSALFGADDLALMVSLNLVNANGSAFDPATYTQFRTWLLNATATNMAYMLSAQLATMELNVLNGFVSASALVYAPGSTAANAAGFATVQALMDEANASLGADPYTVDAGSVRTYQEQLKNALDAANNNKTFVQASVASCPDWRPYR